jgi:hypothetical protein
MKQAVLARVLTGSKHVQTRIVKENSFPMEGIYKGKTKSY